MFHGLPLQSKVGWTQSLLVRASISWHHLWHGQHRQCNAPGYHTVKESWHYIITITCLYLHSAYLLSARSSWTMGHLVLTTVHRQSPILYHLVVRQLVIPIWQLLYGNTRDLNYSIQQYSIWHKKIILTCENPFKTFYAKSWNSLNMNQW